MAAVGKRRPRRVSGTAAVGRRSRTRRVSSTRAPRRRTRRVSGTAAVGRTGRRRRRVGSTGTSGMVKQIVPMAVGMGAGVGIQHFILRPLEAKIATHSPMAAKFFGAGEIFLGGYMALKAKNPIMKGAGLGIMAGGVQTVSKQFNIYHENPAVSGIGDYTTVRIPVGELDNMLNGIVMNRNGDTRTSLVAGMDDYSMNGRISDERVQRTNLLAGIYGLNSVGAEEDDYLLPKGTF